MARPGAASWQTPAQHAGPTGPVTAIARAGSELRGRTHDRGCSRSVWDRHRREPCQVRYFGAWLLRPALCLPLCSRRSPWPQARVRCLSSDAGVRTQEPCSQQFEKRGAPRNSSLSTTLPSGASMPSRAPSILKNSLGSKGVSSGRKKGRQGWVKGHPQRTW